MPRNDSWNTDPFTTPPSLPFSRGEDPCDIDPFGPPIDYPHIPDHDLSTDYSVESISDYLQYAEGIQAEDIAIEEEILLLSASLSNIEISLPTQPQTSPTISTIAQKESIEDLPTVATNVIKESIDNFLRLSSDDTDIRK